MSRRQSAGRVGDRVGLAQLGFSLTAVLVDILLCSLLSLLLLFLLFVVLLLLCCIKPFLISVSGFVFHSLCGGGAAATWSQTPAGTKPPQQVYPSLTLSAEIKIPNFTVPSWTSMRSQVTLISQGFISALNMYQDNSLFLERSWLLLMVGFKSPV